MLKGISIAVPLLLTITGSISVGETPRSVGFDESTQAEMPAGDPDQLSRIFELTTPRSGWVTIDVHSLDFDTTVEVVELGGDGMQTPVGENDDGPIGTDSSFSFEAGEGARYRIDVGCFEREPWGGTFELQVSEGKRPSLDQDAIREAELRYWDQVLERSRELENPLREARAYRSKAYHIRGRPETDQQAREFYGRAIDLIERHAGGDHPLVASTLVSWAEHEEKLDRREEARSLLERALDIRERKLEPDDLSTADVAAELGWTLNELEAYDQAQPVLEKALAIRQSRLPADDPKVTMLLNNLGFSLVRSGEYERALPLLEKRIALSKARSPDGTVAEATTQLLLTDLLWNLGAHAEAKPHALRALEILERELGVDDGRVAEALEWLGTVTGRLEDFEESEKHYRRAVQIYEASVGPRHPAVASALNGLALALYRSGEFTEAERLVRRAVEIQRAKNDEESMQSGLRKLGWTLHSGGKNVEAQEAFEQRCDLLGRMPGADVADLVECHDDLGWIQLEMGAKHEALKSHRRALRILQERNPADGVAIAAVLYRIADVEASLGRPNSIRGTIQQAIFLHERSTSTTDLGLVPYLSRLALSSVWSSRFSTGEAALRRALAIQSSVPGNEGPEIANTLNGHAVFLSLLGQPVKAREELDRARRLLENEPAARELTYQTVLRNLAIVLWDMGQLREARRMYERFLPLAETAFVDEPYRLAHYRLELALLLGAQKAPAESVEILEQVIHDLEEMGETVFGEVMKGQLLLARMLWDAGQKDRAREICSELNRIFRGKETGESTVNLLFFADGYWHLGSSAQQLHGISAGFELIKIVEDSDEHPIGELPIRAFMRHVDKLSPFVFEAMAGVAESLWSTEKPKKAHKLATRLASILDAQLDEVIPFLPERDAMQMVGSRPHPENVMFSGLVFDEGGRPEWLAACWEWTLRRRALVLDELAKRHRHGLIGADEEVSDAFDRFEQARHRLAAVWIRGLYGAASDSYAEELKQTREARDRAEETLAGLSAQFREARAYRESSLDDVANALPGESALVEYVRVPIRRPDELEATPHYIALVLRGADKRSAFADLGPAAHAEKLVLEWHDRLRRTYELDGDSGIVDLRELLESGSRLRRAVWDPVAEQIGDARLVFIVADGSLHQLNFSALPTDGERYLVEGDRRFHLLSTGRDMVRLSAPTTVSGRGLLALGDPNFDASAEDRVAQSSGAAESSSYRGYPSSCSGVARKDWGRLPASGLEVREIGALLAGHEPVTVLTGAGASEERFKAEAPGKRIIHLATHGFFLQDRCASATMIARGMTKLAVSPPPIDGTSHESGAVSPYGENPLLLSGLVLAGANRAYEAGLESDDGVLTAEEIAAMDLRGVEIAALSSCDTGLGTVAVGEGVFGLRRSFEIAGARTVLTSLWSVPDEAAQGWMRSFYTARVAGESILDATRRANLTMLRESRDDDRAAHPYDWAGFVAAGDWR